MRTRNVILGLSLLSVACGGPSAGSAARAERERVGSGAESAARAGVDEGVRAAGEETGEALDAPVAAGAEMLGEAEAAAAAAAAQAEGEQMRAEGEAAATAMRAADEQPELPQETNSCPADLESLEVRATRAQGGGALVFTSAESDHQALRGRLRLFAKLHELARLERRAAGRAEDKPEGRGAIARAADAPPGAQPKLLENPPPQRFADSSGLLHQASEMRVVETARGARLEIAFEDRRQLRNLRNELRDHAEQLTEGICPLAFSTEPQA